MKNWTPFPHTDHYPFDPASLTQHWARLHAGDAEPLPTDPAVLEAWVLFHGGHFQAAAQQGLQAGLAGTTVAARATATYAHYLEAKESARLKLFKEVVERTQEQAQQEPGNANAWYWHAYALGRYSQGISVAKALALGLGSQVKAALEKTIALSPRHADAHIALGTFHAEVIDKVGVLVGGMTYGAKKEVGLRLFEQALRLNPHSASARIEYANALVMLEGQGKANEATALYEQAAASTPLDAYECLAMETARTELLG